MLPRRSARCLRAAAALSLLTAWRVDAAQPAPRQWGSALAAVPSDLPAWRALYEEARRRHGFPWEAAWAFAPEASTAVPAREVPLPLAKDAWRSLLGRPDLADEDVAAAILADRRSTLLYRGLCAFDEETLSALAADPVALARVRERHADVLALFGGRFRVRGGRVDVPGGEEAAEAWEAVVGEKPSAPLPFLLALLEGADGRRALLYDSVARLDPARRRFALSLDRPPPARAAALRRLGSVFEGERAWWRGGSGAHARPESDAARVLREVGLAPDGTFAAPTRRPFWAAVWGQPPPRGEEAEAVADAAWAAEAFSGGGPEESRARLEQLSFAQRTLGDPGEPTWPDLILAVRGIREARALVLALERMGARDPALFAAGVRAARRASAAGGEAAERAHRGLQGGLALVDRARVSRVLTAEAAGLLAAALYALPLDDAGAWPPGLARWVEADLVPAAAAGVYGGLAGGDAETTLLRAVAGDVLEAELSGERFEWDGVSCRADPGPAESMRLDRVRERQGGPRLDEVLARCAEAPARTCGEDLGSALAALAYASALGDPEGPALGGGDPSSRHRFLPEPVALPEERSGPGVTWHVRGSLLGLERSLARLALPPPEEDAMPAAPPALGEKDRLTLVGAVALANPRDLDAAGRDAVAAAVAAGRRRTAGLGAGSSAVAEAAREAGLEPARAQALDWVLAREPAGAEALLSLAELARLGGGAGLDAWGTGDEIAAGLRVRFPPPVPLDESAGRASHLVLGTSFVDLQLRVAEHLAQRRLPAALAPAVVWRLLPGLLFEARPLFPGDRLALEAWVRGLDPGRLDRAVAAVAAEWGAAASPRGAR